MNLWLIWCVRLILILKMKRENREMIDIKIDDEDVAGELQ